MVEETALEFYLPDRQATEELGKRLATVLERGSLIALDGPLGAGKTTLVKGLARGLEIDELVSSPTFTMLNEYVSGRIPLYHLDLYRLAEDGMEQNLDWLAVELDELSMSSGIILIEWAELFSDWIAQQDRIVVELNYSTNAVPFIDDSTTAEQVGRSASIRAFGGRSKAQLEKLRII